MKLQTSFVLVEDFDLKAIQKAYKEGRLYVRPASTVIPDRQQAIADILRYVSRIDSCASPAYSAHIRRIWEALLRHEMLGELFYFTRYRNTRGQINWYRVNVFICLLREIHVYQSDRYTGVYLHCRCEGISHHNNHFTGMGRYLLNHRQIAMVNQIVRAYS